MRGPALKRNLFRADLDDAEASPATKQAAEKCGHCQGVTEPAPVGGGAATCVAACVSPQLPTVSLHSELVIRRSHDRPATAGGSVLHFPQPVKFAGFHLSGAYRPRALYSLLGSEFPEVSLFSSLVVQNIGSISLYLVDQPLLRSKFRIFPAHSLQVPWSIQNRLCLCGLRDENFFSGKNSLTNSVRREFSVSKAGMKINDRGSDTSR